MEFTLCVVMPSEIISFQTADFNLKNINIFLLKTNVGLKYGFAGLLPEAF